MRVVAVFCAWLTSSSVLAAEQLVTVGVYDNPPKVFVSEAGQSEGIFIDIIEHIAQKEGWRLEYVSGSWAQGLDRLEQGDIDLMPDVAYTSERERNYSFHKVPVLSSWFQVYARRGSGIRSILDLKNKRIAVLEGSVQQDALRRLASGFGVSTTLISASSYDAVFQAVVRGEADAAVSNQFYGAKHARGLGLEDTAIIFNPSDLFFAARRGEQAVLLSAIDRHLRALKNDPQSIYYRSLKKWTSEEVHFEPPAWLVILGQALGFLLVASLLGSVALRRQVNVRTRQLERKNHEVQALNEELRQQTIVLEQRVAERTGELVAARDQAQSADRLKSAFLASMSHELRTPLNSIIGFSGILLQGLAGPLNEEQSKQLAMVRSSSEHLLALINDVLDLSKIEAGQVQLAIAPFDLAVSIEKVVATARPLAQKKGLALEIDIAIPETTVWSDQRRVEQVLLNLLSNGIKFTERGAVRVETSQQDARVFVCVSDTGMGIQEADIVKLFAPFSQVDTGLSRRHEGTGLGLSICKKLVELLGGAIWVKSEWGKGSTFGFDLPVQGGMP
jgi:hypothetical protein